MDIKISKYKYEPVEIESTNFVIPEKTVYFFETGIRRSIRIIPVFHERWKPKEGENKRSFDLKITCVYMSSECKIEKYHISEKEFEEAYYYDKHQHKEFVNAFVSGWFDKRTEERFNNDLDYAITEVKNISY